MTSRPASAEYVNGKQRARRKSRLTERRWWPWLKTAVRTAFFLLVACLLFKLARSVAWQQVFDTMRARPLNGLLFAALLATGSYALYGCFDLLGRHLTRHTLKSWQVICISLICYAFNFNLGATLGGAAFRLRLYSRLGLHIETVARVLITSTLTNWLGYFVLGGLVFFFRPLTLPPNWKIDSFGLHLLGAGMLVIATAYLLLCAFAGGRSRTIRGYELTVPSLRFALLQLAMSCLNWLLITGVLFVLLEQEIPFTDVLCVLLIASIAGIVTHVPGGLGVIEAVFVALLSHRMPSGELLASVLMFRLIYYIVPLALATVGYAAMEAKIGKKA